MFIIHVCYICSVQSQWVKVAFASLSLQEEVPFLSLVIKKLDV